MRHTSQVDDDSFASDRLTQRDGSFVFRLLEVLRSDELTEEYRFALLVRQLDADRVPTLNDSDTRAHGRHRARDVIREPDHARRLDAGRRL